MQVYNLHRSPYFWDKPDEFEPERFLVQKTSEGIEGWDGFDPSRSPGALYPNEVNLTVLDNAKQYLFCSLEYPLIDLARDNIRSYPILHSCLLVVDRESVWETSLR